MNNQPEWKQTPTITPISQADNRIPSWNQNLNRPPGESRWKQWLCPFPMCGYETDRESWLKTHMRKHTGERPFACDFCQYRSAQKSNLTVHMRKVHMTHLLQKNNENSVNII